MKIWIIYVRKVMTAGWNALHVSIFLLCAWWWMCLRVMRKSRRKSSHHRFEQNGACCRALWEDEHNVFGIMIFIWWLCQSNWEELSIFLTVCAVRNTNIALVKNKHTLLLQDTMMSHLSLPHTAQHLCYLQRLINMAWCAACHMHK